MAVNPADMDSCNIKNTCLGGINDGVAYDPESPCGGALGVVFNPVSCDCESELFCADSGSYGVDISYHISSANTYWAIKPCLASVCFVDCKRDRYQQCGNMPESSGTFFLAPGQCLYKVKEDAPGACPETSPMPGGFRTEAWYGCPPGIGTPTYNNCGLWKVRTPTTGICSMVVLGPGIAETGRVPRPAP